MTRPLCRKCGLKPCAVNYLKKNIRHYRSSCTDCNVKRKPFGPKQLGWKRAGYKIKSHCERCGFKAKLPQQLFVYYTDGNSTNNNHFNLKTVCANCSIEIIKTGDSWKQGDLVPDQGINFRK